MTQPLFMKLNTGGGIYEFINLMYIVSVKFVRKTGEDNTGTVTLQLVNGKYHTVMGESAEKLIRALENMDPLRVSETSEDYGAIKMEMTGAQATTSQNLDLSN
ncbi:MAG: hypothetical protein WCF57_12910 [Pyrinomonadaceae bacterium]